MEMAMANDRRTTNDDGGEKHLGRCRWDGGLGTRTANVERTRQRIGLWMIGQSVGLDDHRQEKCLDARPARRGELLLLGEGRLANESRTLRIN